MIQVLSTKESFLFFFFRRLLSSLIFLLLRPSLSLPPRLVFLNASSPSSHLHEDQEFIHGAILSRQRLGKIFAVKCVGTVVREMINVSSYRTGLSLTLWIMGLTSTIMTKSTRNNYKSMFFPSVSILDIYFSYIIKFYV